MFRPYSDFEISLTGDYLKVINSWYNSILFANGSFQLDEKNQIDFRLEKFKDFLIKDILDFIKINSSFELDYVDHRFQEITLKDKSQLKIEIGNDSFKVHHCSKIGSRIRPEGW